MARPSLPPDLEDLDRMLWRWAADHIALGPNGMPRMSTLEKIRLLRDGAALGQSDAPTPIEYFQLDEIIDNAREEVRTFVMVWYRDPRVTVQQKADRIGVHRSTMYIRWKEALRSIQGAMREKGVAVIS